ncbi:ABC transporter substrate-binding protein [Paenibacillus sp. TRM 82003]|nr:ABC transporter substrate-binding protein [Paenibacillus sp. TRM 82003]
MLFRKWVAAFLILALSAIILAACTEDNGDEAASNDETQTTEKAAETATPAAAPAVEATGGGAGEQKEAPMLAELVKAGSLPPVEERLPAKEDIMIEPVYEEIGVYGGDLRIPWKGADDKWTIGKPTEEALFRFTADGTGVEPNVAKGYDVNDNATEYTIHLREGMKWSDGMPFTADDVIFYWEHMLLKETFGKSLYDCYYSVDPATGEKARADVTKVDDYTVKVTFQHPNVLFLERLAIDNKWFFAPAHYYKTILPEFIGEEAALAKVKEYGFEDLQNFNVWTGYYYWVYPERPTLRAWMATNDANSDTFVMERNPYYFKTDAEGKQLPYIDRIVLPKIQDDSQKLLDTLAGKTSLTTLGFKDFTVLKENESKGDYRIIRWNTADWASTSVQLNQTTEDPKLRALFQDIRFREALSLAVDREQVSEIVTLGLGAPQQASVPEGLANYQDGWASQWAAYDVDGASKLLDEIGLKWDGAKKFRTYADGSELTLTIYQDGSGDNAEYIELLKNYYEAVGLRTNVKIVDQGNYNELKYANQIPISVQNVSAVNVAFRPDVLVPLRVLTPWLGHYGLHTSSGGKEGVKPEGDVAQILVEWDKVKAATTKDQILAASDEIIKLHKKNQWIVGYTAPTPVLIVAKNDLRNVNENLIYADEFRDLGHAHPAQFFFKK